MSVLIGWIVSMSVFVFLNQVSRWYSFSCLILWFCSLFSWLQSTEVDDNPPSFHHPCLISMWCFFTFTFTCSSLYTLPQMYGIEYTDLWCFLQRWGMDMFWERYFSSKSDIFKDISSEPMERYDTFGQNVMSKTTKIFMLVWIVKHNTKLSWLYNKLGINCKVQYVLFLPLSYLGKILVDIMSKIESKSLKFCFFFSFLFCCC